jgi:threonine aldolase
MTRLHDTEHRAFASDNNAGVHPEVLAAIAEANGGHQPAYGADAYTERLARVIREHFGERAEAFPVFNGTGANVTALSALVPRWGAIITSGYAHVHTDEGGAPEKVSGIKIWPVQTPDGKLTPALLASEARGLGDEHRAQPAAVSLTQSTELGTVYTPDELRAITDAAHAHDLAVHVDGARLWNAAASLGLPFRAFTTDVGVDVVSLGGTKNGLLGAEAIVVLDPSRVTGLRYLRKSLMQLPSKMRFTSAQMLALFDDELGLRSAARANAMATRLREGLDSAIASGAIAGLIPVAPTQANAVLVAGPRALIERVRERERFYIVGGDPAVARWMTSFDTTEADVDRLLASVREACTERSHPRP